MKNCKIIFVDDYITIRDAARKAGLLLSEANMCEVSIKDNTLILKPTVSPYGAEKLAATFLMDQCSLAKCYPCFEINHHQRVIACAVDNYVGVAYCSKEDNFSVTIGKALALSRALRIPLPPLLQAYLGLK